MILANPAKQFPSLNAYLNASKEPAPVAKFMWPAVLTAGGAIAGASGVSLLARIGDPAQLIPIIIGFGGMAIGIWRLLVTYQSLPRPTRRELDANKAAGVLRKLIEARRLHRDLDSGTLILLEESAHAWGRIHAALGSGYWATDGAPASIQTARNQVRAAADSGMEEILAMYVHHLPGDVGSRHAMDYVQEALESFTGKGSRDTSGPPPVFYAARDIGEKLRSLAQESENLATRTHIEQASASRSELDAALGELRLLKAAEDELRQQA